MLTRLFSVARKPLVEDVIGVAGLFAGLFVALFLLPVF